MCHLHTASGKTPKSSKRSPKKSPAKSSRKSPTKSSPKRSPVGKKQFDLDKLSKVELYEVMLNVPRDTINALCRANKKYADICRIERFRQEYNARHKNMLIVGKLKLKKPGREGDLIKKIRFIDEAENEIQIEIMYLTRIGSYGISKIIYIPKNQIYPKSLPKNLVIDDKVVSELLRNKVFIGCDQGKFGIGRSKEQKIKIDKEIEAQEVLKYIGKEKWFRKIKDAGSLIDEDRNLLNKDYVIDFIKIIEKAVENIDGSISFSDIKLWWQLEGFDWSRVM